MSARLAGCEGDQTRGGCSGCGPGQQRDRSAEQGEAHDGRTARGLGRITAGKFARLSVLMAVARRAVVGLMAAAGTGTAAAVAPVDAGEVHDSETEVAVGEAANAVAVAPGATAAEPVADAATAVGLAAKAAVRPVAATYCVISRDPLGLCVFGCWAGIPRTPCWPGVWAAGAGAPGVGETRAMAAVTAVAVDEGKPKVAAGEAGVIGAAGRRSEAAGA